MVVASARLDGGVAALCSPSTFCPLTRTQEAFMSVPELTCGPGILSAQAFSVPVSLGSSCFRWRTLASLFQILGNPGALVLTPFLFLYSWNPLCQFTAFSDVRIYQCYKKGKKKRQ